MDSKCGGSARSPLKTCNNPFAARAPTPLAGRVNGWANSPEPEQLFVIPPLNAQTIDVRPASRVLDFPRDQGAFLCKVRSASSLSYRAYGGMTSQSFGEGWEITSK